MEASLSLSDLIPVKEEGKAAGATRQPNSNEEESKNAVKSLIEMQNYRTFKNCWQAREGGD